MTTQQYAPQGQIPAQISGAGQSVQQSPHGMIGQQPGQGARSIPEAIINISSAALAAVLDHLQRDPAARQLLAVQGQLTPQAHANVTLEASRRIASTVVETVNSVCGGQQQLGQQPYGQQLSWQQPMGQQQPFGQQQPYGQQPSWQQPSWQQPMGQQQPFGQQQPY
ncbi:hypothetical protein ABZ790_06010, partial [Saccharopolyspora shandongensis]